MRIGGTEMVIKNLVEGIDKTKFDVEILCIEPKLGPFGEQLTEKGIKITNLHWLGGFDTRLIKRIRQYIKQNKIDVLHCHQYTPWVYGTMAAAFSKAKVIFTEHGRFYPDSSSWKRKFINPVLLAFTDHITAISKATKQALVDFEYIPAKKIEVIYNGIKPLIADENKVKQLREQYEIPADEKILGTVARLDPIKNQTMMIEAFSMVLKECPNTYLFIVGDGEEREKLENLVDRLHIRCNVIFTGYIAKPVNYIALFDIFLLSSLSEGTSMTLLEAMSLGKPSVVTDAGGNPEVIESGVSGLISTNNHALKYSQNILKAINTFKNIAWKENSLNTFNERFHMKKMTKNYQSIYGEVK